MVTIKSIRKNQTTDGREFISLELQSGVEAVQSLKTGKMYLTVRKCFISSTFDQQTAEALIGSSLEGTVSRVLCEPYPYTIKATGEIIQLSHTYQYEPVDNPAVTSKGEVEFA